MEQKQADHSLACLLNYCDELGRSGKWRKNTASAMKTACERLLVDLSPDEKKDVRRIDVDAAATKFSNRSTAKSSTCQEYRRRVLAAIAGFSKSTETIESRPLSYGHTSSPAIDSSAHEKIEKPERDKPVRIPKEAPSSTAITLQIPVRSDFMAQLVLPYDLTSAEAERLSKILEALPMSAGS